MIVANESKQDETDRDRTLLRRTCPRGTEEYAASGIRSERCLA
jgi:hypothetical protein